MRVQLVLGRDGRSLWRGRFRRAVEFKGQVRVERFEQPGLFWEFKGSAKSSVLAVRRNSPVRPGPRSKRLHTLSREFLPP